MSVQIISQKIVPFLWFDDDAEEAANFYTSCFKHSKMGSLSRYDEASAKASGRPKGSVLTASFQLSGQEFMALNGGPVFKFTPSISFFVNCETEEEIDELWKKFSTGGKTLMELDAYPFSKKYGWVQDQYGVSWQLNFTGTAQKIIPFLMFTGNRHGKAEEAINFYVSLFKNSEVGQIVPYSKDDATVMHARFSLNGQEFMAMDSKEKHDFNFTPAVSYFVNCETQQEVDHFWNELTKGGKEVECGWLEDKYGVSWQIVPTVLGQLLQGPDREKSKRVMQAMLKMKKLDVETLRNA